MKHSIASSLLVIQSEETCRFSILNLFDLSEVTVSAIPNIEQLEVQFDDAFFDTIVVSRDFLTEPTNSAMADLQMLVAHSASLIITDTEESKRPEFVPRQSHFDAIRNHQARSKHDVALIADTVAGMNHQCRNVLQRLHIQLDEIGKEARNSAKMQKFAELFHETCFSINDLFETMRRVCSPLELNLELLSLNKFFADCWHEFTGESDPAADLPFEIDDHVMIDTEKLMQSIFEILAFLGDSVGDHSLVRRILFQSDTRQKHFRAGFEVIAPDQPLRANPIICLAFSKRVIQLHGGQLDVVSGDPSRLSCVITIPISDD